MKGETPSPQVSSLQALMSNFASILMAQRTSLQPGPVVSSQCNCVLSVQKTPLLWFSPSLLLPACSCPFQNMGGFAPCL